MKNRCVIAVAVALSLAGALRPVSAAEDHLAFLRALQRAGYGDMAIEYLKRIEKRPDLPPLLKDSIDLQYANSYWAAAASAYNEEETLKLRAEAQKRLDQFIKTKPNHPALADAMITWGEMSFQQGLRNVYGSKTTPDPKQKAQLLADARKSFDEARPRFVKSEERFHALHKERKATLAERVKKEQDAAAKKPGGKGRTAPRNFPLPEEKALEEVAGPWIDSMAKCALVDYWAAQTYATEGKEADTRKQLLKASLKQFVHIYQLFRVERAGVYAHLWRAKVHFELGEMEDARDICEEVLANAPEEVGPGGEIDSMFVEAQLLWLRILRQDGRAEEAIAEATQWLKANRALQKAPEYQGIALELAKMQIAALEVEKSTTMRRSLQQLAMKLLTDVGKIRSEYQQEAILLKREISKTMEGPALKDAATFDEALAVANVSADNQRWEEAAGLYEKALELLEKHRVTPKMKTELLADVTERLATVRYQIARSWYVKKEAEQAFVAAEKIAREYPNTSIAPSAAGLAGYVALDMYRAAKDDAARKGPALDRLVKITDYTIAQWPNRAEADDARLALAQASVERGEFDKAVEQFTAVNIKSPRYPKAMLLAAFETWQQYRREKAKPEKERDAAKMTTWRANAEKWLKISIEGQTAALKHDTNPAEAAGQLANSQSLLAGLYMEGSQFAEAAKLYQPLVEKIAAAKPDKVDPAEMALFAGAVRAYVALGEADKAAEVALSLAEFTGDEPAVNAVLLDAVKVFVVELKTMEAAAINASGAGEEKDTGATADAVASAKQTLGRLVDAMANRQQFPVTVQIYLGEIAVKAGRKEQAQARFNRVVREAENDKEFATKQAAALIRVRAQLLGMLRDEGKHAEALAQIDKLLETHPKSLDLLMQRGRILQDVAQKQPDKYPEAVAHWTKLREMLKNSRTKPPEYYEVIYYAAECLVFESTLTKNPERAQIAEQLLRSTMALSAKLSGPDMVAKYNVLLKRVTAITAKAKAKE